MITLFKIFETINIGEPKINDYVICNETSGELEVDKFISENIGQIYAKDHNKNRIYVKFDNVPKRLKSNFDFVPNNSSIFRYRSRWMLLEEIIYWSKNKEGLEIILAQQNYNL